MSRLHDRAADICATMASSSDVLQSMPAWRMADASDDVEACRLAKQAVSVVQLTGARYASVREWWAEAESLLRNDRWSPGDDIFMFPPDKWCDPTEPAADVSDLTEWLPETTPVSEDALDQETESIDEDYFDTKEDFS